MQKNVGARLMFSAAMLIFGTLGVFTRNIDVTSGELALYRAVLATALIGAYLLLFNKGGLGLKSAGRELPLLLASGIAMGINWILLFQAVSGVPLHHNFRSDAELLLCPRYRHRRVAAAVPRAADRQTDYLFCHVHAWSGNDYRPWRQ